MPVGTVGAGRGIDGADDLGELVATGGVPKGNGAGIKVDLIDTVVPDTGLHGGVPLLGRVGHPLQRGVAGTTAAAGQAVLQLGKVGLEEGDLVLAGDGRGIGVLAHDGEVVVERAGGDGAGVRGLGDELGTAHGLALPVGGGGQRDLGTLGDGAIIGVGVGRVEGDVVGGVAGTVNVPLVLADLVGPGPVFQRGDGHVIEAARPYGGTRGSKADEVGSDGSESGMLDHFGGV